MELLFPLSFVLLTEVDWMKGTKRSFRPKVASQHIQTVIHVALKRDQTRHNN